MNFFCTKKHYDERTEAMRIQEAYCLDARTALREARALFGE